ncbi:MAG: carboxypeptidase-like regulatory domain-containing protein [Acidobacteriota bacterium]
MSEEIAGEEAEGAVDLSSPRTGQWVLDEVPPSLQGFEGSLSAMGGRLSVLSGEGAGIASIQDAMWRPHQRAIDFSFHGDCPREAPWVVELPGWVASGRGLDAECRGRLELRPAAEIRGRVDAPEPIDLLVAEWAPCLTKREPDPGKPAAGTENGSEKGWSLLPVGEGGKVAGTLPAGCWDVVLRPVTAAGWQSSGWTSLNLPTRDLRQGERTSWGTLRFRPGAALLVRVLRPDGSPAAGEKIQLIRPEGCDGPSSTVGGDGWLRFAGLEEGAYLLRTEPFPGAPAYLQGPFSLRAGAELLLPDLELPRAAFLNLEIQPGDLAQENDLGVARVRVTFEAGCGESGVEIFDHELPWFEPLELGPLPPGRGVVEASVDRREAGTAVRFARESFELAGGERRWMSLEARGGFYPGRLVVPAPASEDEPTGVRARLSWAPAGPVEQEPDPRTSTETYSDASGDFVVGLAAPGSYRVTAYLAQDDPGVDLGEVKVHENDEPIELELPTGRVRGQVLSEEGQPVPGAQIFARSESFRSLLDEGTAMEALRGDVSADDGSFELLGVPEGRYRITALVGLEEGEGALRISQPAVVEITDDRSSVEGVELRFGAHRRISGRLTTTDGRPVNGTFRAVVREADETPRLYLPLRAGADGSFEVEMPDDLDGPVDLELRLPGLPLSLQRLAPDESFEDLDLRLPLQGATLELPRGIEADPRGSWRLVTEGGAHVSLGDLMPPGNVVRPGGAEDTGSATLHLAPGLWVVLEPGTGRGELLELAPGDVHRLGLAPNVGPPSPD